MWKKNVFSLLWRLGRPKWSACSRPATRRDTSVSVSNASVVVVHRRHFSLGKKHFLEFSIEYFRIPGYYVTGSDDESPSVFTGDTLFLSGCGKFFEGTADQMFDNLINKLGKLPEETASFSPIAQTITACFSLVAKKDFEKISEFFFEFGRKFTVATSTVCRIWSSASRLIRKTRTFNTKWNMPL